MSSQAESPEHESRWRQVAAGLTPIAGASSTPSPRRSSSSSSGELVHPGFASPASVQAMLVIASFVGFVAAGQMFVILVGGIDLSMPWVLNAAAIVLTTSLGRTDARFRPCSSRSASA